MKIVLWGYGKMGKEIEKNAIKRHHTIHSIITKEKSSAIDWEHLKQCDVVIEFTNPISGFQNVSNCLKNGISVVSGTTGWNEKKKEAEKLAIKNNCSLIISSNFSIGVNLFFAFNAYIAEKMNTHNNYDVEMDEIHHLEKKDKPSGTAITTVNILSDNLNIKDNWKLDDGIREKSKISIHSKRIKDVIGTHSTKFFSNIDDITLTHKAHNRQGFSLGTILAAEYIAKKQGVFSMKDVLNINY